MATTRSVPDEIRLACAEGRRQTDHAHDDANRKRGQEEHHRVKSFKEEYIAFLKKNGIEYDERYVFD